MTDDEQDAGAVTVPVVAEPPVAVAPRVEMAWVEAKRERWRFLLGLAKAVHEAGMAPSNHRTAQQTAVVMLTGDAFGFAEMQSLGLIDVVQGKARLSSKAMTGLVRRQGLGRFAYDVDEDAFVVKVTGTRSDTRAVYGEVYSSTWTLEKAERAGLLNKDNWKKHPIAMLTARAEGDVCNHLFSDILGTCYTPDEMDELREADVPALVAGQGAGAKARAALGLPDADTTEGPGTDTEAGADGAPAADDQTPGPEGDDNDTRLSASGEGSAPLFDIGDDEVPLDVEGEGDGLC